MPVLEAVIQWAMDDLEDWQADAVRRILTQESLAEQDVSELLLILKSKHGLTQPTDAVPTPVTLKDTGVSGAAQKPQPLVLQAIENLSNVNAIPDGSSLSFGTTGLTLIYGNNAAGKSGYARVLKKACKARHDEPIHANVFAAAPSGPASATFSISIGDNTQEIAWAANEQGSDILSNICVFDSKCSRITVDEENEPSYVPYGGDVFPKLVQLMQQLRQRLEREKPTPTRPDAGDIPAGTAAFQFLAGLNDRTTPAEVDASTKWTQEDQQKLEQLTRDVAKADVDAGDTTKRVSAIRSMKNRITELLCKIKGIHSTLSSEKEVILTQQVKDLQICERAFRISSQESFDFPMEPLPGVGESEWQELYRAAKEYSVKFAYQGKEFPQTGEGDLCVLCMQPLSQDAKNRLQRFKKFMEQSAKQKRDAAEQQLKTTLKDLEDLDFGITESYKDAIGEIKNRDASCADRIKDYVEKMLARKMCMASMGTSQSLVDNIPPVIQSPLSELQTIVDTLEVEAQSLAKLSGPATLVTVRQQKRELEVRQKLSDKKSEIRKYLEALKTAKRYDDAIRETDHTGVTKKGTQIKSSALTPSFQARLNTEFANLGVQLSFNLVASGCEGEMRYKLKLDNCHLPRGAALTEILSEGEERVVAIASFLAELNASGHTNPIVMDDPVSSLDHIWREKVAKRLVDEARGRQVIVFTHDIVFATDIKNHAESSGVNLMEWNVCLCGRNPGSVEPDIPWIARNIEQRIATLEKELSASKMAYSTKKDYEYADMVRTLYDRLRATCERALEDVAFSGIVLRHRDWIPVNHTLKKVLALDAAMCDVLINLHGKCSNITEAHDLSRARNAPVPSPDEIAADIKTLKDWVHAVKEKQKAFT